MGFDRDHILLASIDPAKSGYTRPRTAVFFAALLQRLRSHEAIKAVGLASHGTLSGVLPAGTRFMSTQMHSDSAIEPSSRDLTIYQNVVSRGYFEASGISLVRGRDFADSDGGRGVEVGILNEAAAQLLFGNDDPIGKRIGPGRQGPTNIEVAGVVENAKYLSVREAPVPTVYVPFRDGSPMTLHVKTDGDLRSALRVIEQELQALDSDPAALSSADHRSACRRCASSGTAGGDVGDHLERVGHAHSRRRPLRPDRGFGRSTNARNRNTNRGRSTATSDPVAGARASLCAGSSGNGSRSPGSPGLPARRRQLSLRREPLAPRHPGGRARDRHGRRPLGRSYSGEPCGAN